MVPSGGSLSVHLLTFGITHLVHTALGVILQHICHYLIVVLRSILLTIARETKVTLEGTTSVYRL